ncbi:methylated-DNA--[protein]-cysteine S-methyltransferase [Actinacidiphila acididurans]|uniref:Methylated-DNA--[protein]-cysteine S-methyltransferase n=1 Tax=Actinacidiphila acididurans TaxID=2784346 RepID=A0ABS2U8C3_9ACTN|nr:methylated-DNA--[protein]-cysteine S-methyltransferase [Actinacidiphila acididurans]MBM9510413.1 methylated-DNA--[protein]-cysteine S-methyltransferase [Actinacidiphila acididurans]
MTAWTTITSPLGDLLLVGEPGEDGTSLASLTSLSMPGRRGATAVRDDWSHDPTLFADVADQVRAYFAGERVEFRIPFTPGGSAFQRQVWQALEEIPYGTSTTYGELTARIGLPRERVQAVGAAIGANPLLLVRPCHRVIGADGSMRGYAGGVERKVQLLTLEGVLQPTLM